VALGLEEEEKRKMKEEEEEKEKGRRVERMMVGEEGYWWWSGIKFDHNNPSITVNYYYCSSKQMNAPRVAYRRELEGMKVMRMDENKKRAMEKEEKRVRMLHMIAAQVGGDDDDDRRGGGRGAWPLAHLESPFSFPNPPLCSP